MASLFAEQFGFPGAYKPYMWKDGSMNIQANLPRGSTTPEEEPAEAAPVPAPVGEPSLSSPSTGTTANESVGAASQTAAAQSGALSKSMHLAGMANAEPVGNISAANTNAATANLGGKTGGTGIWGDITGAAGQYRHDIASSFDATRHGISSATNWVFSPPGAGATPTPAPVKSAATPTGWSATGGYATKQNALRGYTLSPNGTPINNQQFVDTPKSTEGYWNSTLSPDQEQKLWDDEEDGDLLAGLNSTPAPEINAPSSAPPNYAGYFTAPESQYSAVPNGWSANGGYGSAASKIANDTSGEGGAGAPPSLNWGEITEQAGDDAGSDD